MIETWKDLIKLIEDNIKHGWTLEDIIFEYIEQSDYLIEEMEGINKFLASMDRQYQDEFINFDLRESGIINKTWNYKLSNIYNMAFREVLKHAIMDYCENEEE